VLKTLPLLLVLLFSAQQQSGTLQHCHHWHLPAKLPDAAACCSCSDGPILGHALQQAANAQAEARSGDSAVLLAFMPTWLSGYTAAAFNRQSKE
jgi:hypothetical protein